MNRTVGFSFEPLDNARLATQIDLARGQKSGLNDARIALKDVRGIAFQQFLAEDVVRHPPVQKIVSAYERHEQS
jgi:phosphate starvation-inducible PhoH-like protein